MTKAQAFLIRKAQKNFIRNHIPMKINAGKQLSYFPRGYNADDNEENHLINVLKSQLGLDLQSHLLYESVYNHN